MSSARSTSANLCPSTNTTAHQLATRGESFALTGELQMKTGDIEVSMSLGPEARGGAPLPYDVNTASRDSTLEPIWRASAAHVMAASDVDGARGCRFSNAAVGVAGVDVDLNGLLRLKASQVAVCTLVSFGFESICASVDVNLRSAVIEIESMGPIPLNGIYEPNTVLLPDLLEPLGLHVVVNEQVVPTEPHGIQVTALRMRFDGARFGRSTEVYGELGLGITHAALSLTPLRDPLEVVATNAGPDESRPLLPPARAMSSFGTAGRRRPSEPRRQPRSTGCLAVA